MAQFHSNGRQGGKTQAQEEAFFKAADRVRHELSLAPWRVKLVESGFYVDTKGALKQMPFMGVKMKEAVVDKDFYDRGDDFT